MKTSKSIEAKLTNDIKDLEKEELRLFNAYNRHANSETKLAILESLKVVIIKLNVLKKYNN